MIANIRREAVRIVETESAILSRGAITSASPSSSR
jgi:hypothetical protein